MKIKDIIAELENFAPPSLKEHYDNTGLLTGDPEQECSGVLTSLDTTEQVIEEAVRKSCNLIISHHPVIFSGLKKITGENHVERTVISAIREGIAVYAIHTNLDNVKGGVNGKIANLMGLINTSILSPKENLLKKLFTFVPVDKTASVRQAIFDAGGGHIGNYSECSFNSSGYGTFTGGEGTDPYVGKSGEPHREDEIKIEVIFPLWLENRIISSMIRAHPYEEVAYDIISLDNSQQSVGSGIIGDLSEPVDEKTFLNRLKDIFRTGMIRFTGLTGRPVKKVAVCGGAGSFLILKALSLRADMFITSDIKYHEFFEADGKMVITDIGHYESEQFTISLLQEFLAQKFPTFAVLKTEVNTNPVHYY